ncbi:MAG: methylated-DNA--[protein]-cysteine S-methyltransferase [Armatimonadota bacterium]|nr:methylated-DNA--[protein]-cysteine S-methyltransferase [Armatimonadota bacterium]
MGMAVKKVEGWGWIGVGTTGNGVAKVLLPRKSKREVEEELSGFNNGVNQALADRCVDLLSRYFNGEHVSLEQVPVDWESIPPTYRRILRALKQTLKIGQTITYGELARLCSVPKGARLVGQAMAKNPVPLLVPCHRVVRSDGSFGGFAGGVGLKKKLLELEKRIAMRICSSQ